MNSSVIKIKDTADKIYKYSKPVLSSLNNMQINSPSEMLFLNYLERLISNIFAIEKLLNDVPSYPAIENAIGLILRSNLYDCQQIVYLEHLKQNDNIKYEKAVKAIFAENLQHTIKILKKTTIKKTLSEGINHLKKNNKAILEFIGIDIDTIEKEDFGLKILLPKKFESLTNLYYTYSKYEHFGLNTIIINQNEEDIIERLEIGIHYSLQAILTAFLSLNIRVDELLELNEVLANVIKNDT